MLHLEAILKDMRRLRNSTALPTFSLPHGEFAWVQVHRKKLRSRIIVDFWPATHEFKTTIVNNLAKMYEEYLSVAFQSNTPGFASAHSNTTFAFNTYISFEVARGDEQKWLDRIWKLSQDPKNLKNFDEKD